MLAALFSLLSAQEDNLKNLVDSLLEKYPDYQEAVSRYQQENARFRIEQSLNWFDINFRYQQYDNDFIRDETETTLEHSEVDEKDKQWRIELEKQLFPKDFDNTISNIGNRLDVLRYQQEKILSYHTCSSDIFDDMISWYEADCNIKLLENRLNILYKQNSLLEELEAQNLIEPKILIENLEEIDDKEDDLYDYKEIRTEFEKTYGCDLLPVFLQSFDRFVASQTRPDTLNFSRIINSNINLMHKEAQKIASRLKLSYFYFFMPEVNFTLSYNWRKTQQNWTIEENNLTKDRKRNQDEEYPEGRIELSLPFNVFSNTSGKSALLKAFERELQFRSKEIALAWNSLKIKRLNAFEEAKLEVKRKTRLKELYEKNLLSETTQYNEEPSLLGTNPELKLEIDQLKLEDARIKMKLAEMKLYKEIFLINILGEETK